MSEDIRKLLGVIEKIRDNGKIVKGINEVTKAVERGVAKLVIYADDVDPKEIIMHLPMICKEKDIECLTVPSKSELGKSVGVPVACSSIAILDFGESGDEIKQLLKSIQKN
ncbi:MAG: 50S ribosomal protein L7ae [Candidatus Aenigmarchaeota archaeon ex4484_56]|nr:MAG: 50S ribosomal protein L7ae [Candidatus Aenigmarchaeota archaeon ex4484_56]